MSLEEMQTEVGRLWLQVGAEARAARRKLRATPLNHPDFLAIKRTSENFDNASALLGVVLTITSRLAKDATGAIEDHDN